MLAFVREALAETLTSQIMRPEINPVYTSPSRGVEETRLSVGDQVGRSGRGPVSPPVFTLRRGRVRVGRRLGKDRTPLLH